MLPTHCLHCNIPLLIDKRYDLINLNTVVYYCMCKKYRFWVDSDNGNISDNMHEYYIVINEYKMNSNKTIPITMINSSNDMFFHIYKYIEYKHDLEYLTNKINAILLLA
jgi:hypothetical protein